MARKRKKEAHGGGVHAPAWMISWADMTTLLWACFVMLWSFSTLDLAKFQKAASSLHGAFGVLEGGAMVLDLGEMPPNRAANSPVTADNNRMEQMSQRIKEEAKQEGFEDAITASLSDMGLTIRFSDSALFDPGSIDIKPNVLPVLDYVAGELAAIDNPVQVEGHTDTTPIHTSLFPSNWELSTGRATSIVHYMIEQGEIDPVRLSAAGYAFYHPVALNNSPEGRARNRRVDIIVLNPSLEEPAVANHRDALSFLESDESSGIVMPTVDGPAVSAGSSDTGDITPDENNDSTLSTD